MICIPKPLMGLMGSSYFGGWASTILFIPLLADRHGRKQIFFWSLVVSVMVMFIMVFMSNNFYLTVGLMFIAGMATSGRTTTGFIYAGEFLAPKWRIVFGVAFLFINGLTSLLITIYFDFINKHYIYITCVGMSTSVIGATATQIYAVESPLWLLKKGKVTEAQQVLRKIMFVNKVD
jgi:MFS family permease